MRFFYRIFFLATFFFIAPPALHAALIQSVNLSGAVSNQDTIITSAYSYANTTITQCGYGALVSYSVDGGSFRNYNSIVPPTNPLTPMSGNFSINLGRLSAGVHTLKLQVFAASGSVDSGYRVCAEEYGPMAFSVANGAAPPTLTLTASPAVVQSGGGTVLTWSAVNATSCSASGGWSGSKVVSGAENIASLSANTTFNLTCNGPGGAITRSVMVPVVAGGNAVLNVWLTPASGLADNSYVLFNRQQAQLNWSCGNGNVISGSGGFYLANNQYSSFNTSGAFSGSYTIPLLAKGANTFSFTCYSGYYYGPPYTTYCYWFGCATFGTTYYSSQANKTVTLTTVGTDVGLQLRAGATTVNAGALYSGSPGTASVNLSNGTVFSLNYLAELADISFTSGKWANTQLTRGSQIYGQGLPSSYSWSGTVSNLTATSSGAYTMTTQGPNGSTETVTINVNVPGQTPTLTFAASPNPVNQNQQSILSWSSANATSCTASGDWSGAKALSGTAPTEPLQSAKTYTLSCSNTNGVTERSATVNVSVPYVCGNDICERAAGESLKVCLRDCKPSFFEF